MPKLNVYSKNGALEEQFTTNSGDLTGLGQNVAYNPNDFYVRWETDGGQVSPATSFPFGFVTGVANSGATSNGSNASNATNSSNPASSANSASSNSASSNSSNTSNGSNAPASH